MKRIKFKYKSFLINAFICVCFFFIYLYLGKDIIIQLDPLRDAFEPFFSYADHGNYVIQAIIRLITFTIPYHLGIHPMDFAGTFGLSFKALILIFFGCILTQITFKDTNLKDINPIFTLFFQCSILETLFYTNLWQIECANGFGRFIIAQLFFVLYWTYLIKFFNKDSLPTKKQTVLLCTFALIVGNIQELIAFASAFSLFILLTIDLIKNKKTNLYLLLSLIFVCIGGLLMYFNPNYVFSAKTHTGDVTLQTIILGLKDWKYFFSVYFKEIIIKHLLFHSLIVITFLISFLKGTRKELLVPSSLYIGCFLFFLTFIIAKGDTTHYNIFLENDINFPNFWLTHHDFPLIIRYYLLFIFSLFLNSYIQKIHNTLKNRTIISFVFFILCLIQLNTIYRNANYIFEQNAKLDQFKERKTDFYKIDSMVIHYHTKNLPIYIFEPIYSEGMVEDYTNYLEKMYDITLNENENINVKDKDTALNLFYSTGGYFTEEELKNIKFNYLFKKYNKKFNNKKPVKLYYWMEGIDNTPEYNIKLRIKNKFLNLMNKREDQTI